MFRYLHFLDTNLPGYPATFSDVTDHQFAVRFLDVLDSASLLLSEGALDRLLQILQYLDENEVIVPRQVARRLLELSEADFFWFIARQIAHTVSDPGLSLEAMITMWRQGFCLDAQPGEATGVPWSPRGFIPFTKPYRGLLIDRELCDQFMERLDSVIGIEVMNAAVDIRN